MIVGEIYKAFINCAGGPYFSNRGQVIIANYISKGTKLIYLGNYIFLDLNKNKMILTYRNHTGLMCLTPHTPLHKEDSKNPYNETITEAPK